MSTGRRVPPGPDIAREARWCSPGIKAGARALLDGGTKAAGLRWARRCMPLRSRRSTREATKPPKSGQSQTRLNII